MPWLKSDDKFPQNPKVWDLSDAAYRLYDAGRHYAAEKMTDGWIPTSRVTSLTPKPATKPQIEALVRGRLWHRLPEVCASCLEWREKKKAGPLPRSGYLVHDYLRYNPTRWAVVAEREAKQAAGRAGGQASAQARAVAPAQAELPEMASTRLSTSSSTVLKPVPRTPVPRSDSDTYLGGVGANEPEIPDDPSPDRPAARGSERARGREGLTHVGEVMERLAR